MHTRGLYAASIRRSSLESSKLGTLYPKHLSARGFDIKHAFQVVQSATGFTNAGLAQILSAL